MHIVAVNSMDKIFNYINGELIEPLNNQWLDIHPGISMHGYPCVDIHGWMDGYPSMYIHAWIAMDENPCMHGYRW